MRGKYFVDQMNSFYLGSPDVVVGWKETARLAENDGDELVVFKIPKKNSSEIIVSIEKLIRDKLS
jgi:hypothetical protein